MDLLLLVQKMLAKEPHDVTLVQDARNGRIIIANKEYDALIVDLMMPQLGGEELIRVARRIHPGMRIIMITGLAHSEVDQIRILGPEGADSLLHKPFTRTQLLTALTE